MRIMRYIKPAVRYAAMPGIVPRLKRFDLRFPFIACLIAQIYSAVRLLPPTHAYLNPANTGRYGVGEVVMAAMDRLRQTRAADQMIVFAIITVALALLFGQFAMLILMLGIDTAQAANGASFTSMFETPNPEKDIALMMLDLVFGVPDLFSSRHAPDGPGDINPFQQGLHELFRLYSYAVLALGGVILFYYIFAVVLETAQTGSPFGERFDNIYAPLRLVIAVGLLIPLNYGLNGGQYLTLHIAKWGSGLATNGWQIFNSKLTAVSDKDADGPINPLAAGQEELLGEPKVRNIGGFVEFFYLANMCAYHYEHKGLPSDKPEPSENAHFRKAHSEISPNDEFTLVKPYLVRNQATFVGNDGDGNITLDPEGTYKLVELGTPFWRMTNQDDDDQDDDDQDEGQGAAQFYNYGDVTIRFGHHDYSKYPGHKGGVKPLCGEVTISPDSLNQAGAIEIYKSYFNMIKLMWQSPHVRKFAIRYYLVQNESQELTINEHPACNNNLRPTVGPGGQGGFSWGAACNEPPKSGYVKEIMSSRQSLMNAQVQSARLNYIENGSFNVNEAVQERGWGGAAIWFNDIAAANGSFFSAVYNTPSVTGYPRRMQKIAERKLRTTRDKQSAEAGDVEVFCPHFEDDSPRGDWPKQDKPLGESGCALLKYFDNGSVNAQAGTSTGNALHDLINMMLGTQGLFSIRDNRDIHPLAQITALGRSMIDTSMRNFAMGAAAAVVSRPTTDQEPDSPGESMSKSMVGMALMGALLGAVLHYVLPFMPFIYFFFAVSNWVKEVFEAMIGMPLWAIAHLQLEGKGLPGSAAGEGYFLLFGIFLRPILILFGLIASIAVFSAQAIILHDIFDLVIANLAGHGGYSASDGFFKFDKDEVPFADEIELGRSTLDEFFYTVLYVIILYLMATASFKLIDAIPQNILRWAGSDAKPFSDEQDDATGNLVRNVAIGTRMALQEPLQDATVDVGQGAGHVVSGSSNLAGGLVNSLRSPGTTIGKGT